MNNSHKITFISTIITITVTVILLIATVFYYINNPNNYKLEGKTLIENKNLMLIFSDALSDSKKILLPNDTYKSKFTVFNNSKVTINSYQISFVNIINSFDNDEYVYSLDCISYKDYDLKSKKKYGGCSSLLETNFPRNEGLMIASNKIESFVTHEYTINMTFKETGSAQNYNQGKTIGFKLTIE